MEKKLASMLALILTLAMPLALTSCSSSGTNEEAEPAAEELPVVDAETDALPADLEQTAGTEDPTAGAIDGTQVADSGSLAPITEDPAAAAPPSLDANTTGTEAPVAGTEPNSLIDSPASDTTTAATEYNGPLGSSDEVKATEYTGSLGSESSGSSSMGSSDASGSYTVRRGDTLMKIAYKVHGDIFRWKEILDQNRDVITDANHLRAGTSLRVDGSAQEEDFGGYERYLIKTGDTLGLISNDIYGTKSKWKKLWKMNDKLIKDPNRIYAGFFLRYQFTNQDQMEKDQHMQSQPDPLAGGMGQGAEQRNPSSAGGPTTTTEQAPQQMPMGQ